jgi:hypothetical protein
MPQFSSGTGQASMTVKSCPILSAPEKRRRCRCGQPSAAAGKPEAQVLMLRGSVRFRPFFAIFRGKSRRREPGASAVRDRRYRGHFRGINASGGTRRNIAAADPVSWALGGALLVSLLVHKFGHTLAYRFFSQSAHVLLYDFGGLAAPETWGRCGYLERRSLAVEPGRGTDIRAVNPQGTLSISPRPRRGSRRLRCTRDFD